MIIDERSGSTVAVIRKVGGLISAAWPVRADEPPHQGTAQLDVPEDEDVPPARLFHVRFAPEAAMPLELRLTEATLRLMAHQGIAGGQLPGIPRMSWIRAVYGTGATCRLCGSRIEGHQLEYKIIDADFSSLTSLHALCHSVWRECAERMLTGTDGQDR